jgi:diguanylate cyclase (GGDEF)-like protein
MPGTDRADAAWVSADLPTTARLPGRGSSTRSGGPPPARPPEVLAGFEVLAELGRGTHSTVYRVRRPRPAGSQRPAGEQQGDAEYALKILDNSLVDSEATVVAFRREAALLATVHHPGLTQVHEVGVSEGRPYLVMDVVEGSSLANRLAIGAMPSAQAIALTLDLVDPLTAIHGRGLVHRDLKPANIMIQADGTARLIDFGLTAREVDTVDANTAVGTLTYSAPEQSGMLKRPVDNRSDLYSLGVILFEVLTGVPPFAAADVGELLRMHAVVTAPDVGELAPGTSAELSAVVARLLAKDPDDRYQSGQELAFDLQRLAGVPVPDADPGAPRGSTKPALTGRVAQRTALAERWARAKAGRGGVVVLRGGAGSGKSVLAGEFAAVARAGGGTVLWGAAAADGPVPFAPLRAAVEGHLQAVARMPAPERARGRAAIRAAGHGRSSAMLSRLVPGLGPVLDDRDGTVAEGVGADQDPRALPEQPGSDGPDGQIQFAAAVVSFLSGLSRELGGLVLVLDDVQWLDPDSRGVLAQLPTDDLLVLVTARYEARDRAGVDAFVTAMGAAVDLDLTLGRLDQAEMAEQIRALIPGLAVDARLVSLVSVRSNGNPFVVQEYLRAVVDAGLLRPDWGSWVLDEAGLDALALPQDALGLVLTRVEGLGSGIRELLVVAAAIGTRFRPEAVAAVQGSDQVTVVAALIEAAGRGLLDPRADGGFAFLHDRIREALLADLDAGATADLHRRIAASMEQLPMPAGGYDPDHVYALAHHYLRCDLDVAPDRAFSACWSAGRLALENHAPAEAVAFLESAAERGTELPSEFLLLVGTALMQAGKLLQARECLEQALQQESSVLRRAEIYTRLAEVYRANWNTDAALQAIDSALAELGAPLPHGRLRLLLGTALIFAWSLLKGCARIGFGTAEGARRERCMAVTALHEVGAYVGVISMRADLIVTHALRMPYWANQLGPGRYYALSQRSLGFVYGNLGLRRGARRAFARAMADPSSQDLTQAAQTAHFRGAALFLGSHDDATQWIRDTETIGRWLDVATFLDAATIFNQVAVADGRNRDAEHWLALGRRRLGDRVDDVTSFVGAAAMTYAMLGRSGEAGAELRRMNDLCAGNTALSLTMVRLVSTIYVLVEQGELGAPFEQAVAEYEALGLAPGRVLRPIRMINYQIARGRLAQVRAGGPDDRCALVAVADRAVRMVGRAAGPPELKVRSLLARADLLVLREQPGPALDLLAGIDLYLVPDAPLVAFERALIRARALTLIGSEEARRQARVAWSIATDQHWPHRVAAVAAEFGLATIERGMSSLQPSHASPHSGLERQRLQALQQVSAAASRVLDPGELARIALDETIRILAADRAFLFLTDPQTGGLVAHLGRDAEGQDVPELIGYSTSLVERVRVSGQPLVVTGTEEGAALGAASVVLHGLRSILVAPLQLEGRLLGVVYLDSQVAKGIFTADDAGILTALTNHIATSLETARAAQLEISVQTAQRQRDLADTLQKTLQSMSDTFDPAEVIWRLLDSARRVMACDGVWRLSFDQAAAVTLASIDPVDSEVAYRPVPLDDRLTALLEQEKPVIGTAETVPLALQAELASATSWIAVPLRIHGGTSGLLVLASNRPQANLGETIEVAAVIGAQAMTAYDKAVLFKQVQELAVMDELTGIANRRRFFEVAVRDLAAAKRHGRQLSVLMVDIDHFKRVNDTHGHATGDDVIRIVAGRLAEEIRQTDVIGRYGGEEFALLLQDAGPGNLLPERLRTSVCDTPIETRTGGLEITVSIGLAYLTPDDTDIEAVLSRADKELYRAKELGRNRVCGA